MTKGTRNLIARIKKLIRENDEAIRRYKAWLRTPYEQRSPGQMSSNLSDLATLLCMTRAEMRGKKHFVGKEYDQKAYIQEKLKKAVDWEVQKHDWNKHNEAMHAKNPKYAFNYHETVHPTLPRWVRSTIDAALTAAEVERHRQAQHAPRRAAGRQARQQIAV